MVSQYGRWYDNGAQGTPKCLDKTVIIERKEGTTLEHIYPKGISETSAIYDTSLEGNKHKLGNLCILSASDNRLVDTDPFENKKTVFANSNLYITRKVGAFEEWTEQSYREYFDFLKNASCRIFVA